MTTCKHERLIEGYNGHDCADCGELVYPDGCAPWDDDDDYGWTEYDDDDTREAWLDKWLKRCGWVEGANICTLAGTEEHDFECPFREELKRAAGCLYVKRGDDEAD